MGPCASILPCGTRLHLRHGPIDLIIGAQGDQAGAFRAAQARFESVLDELVKELPLLKQRFTPDKRMPQGKVACRMTAAVRPHCHQFVTPMAAVAGAVADTVLQAMISASRLSRAYVNNGGDIALHLSAKQRFTMAMAGLDGSDLGRINIDAKDGIGGLATSGHKGRSLSLGIADSVTVLAQNAASADVAATLIANAVDLPGHPAIRRVPANQIQPDSDLGDLPVTINCAKLSLAEIHQALHHGHKTARAMIKAGHIHSAALFVQGQSLHCGPMGAIMPDNKETAIHA